jgi:hypothetical protein
LQDQDGNLESITVTAMSDNIWTITRAEGTPAVDAAGGGPLACVVRLGVSWDAINSVFSADGSVVPGWEADASLGCIRAQPTGSALSATTHNGKVIVMEVPSGGIPANWPPILTIGASTSPWFGNSYPLDKIVVGYVSIASDS